MAAGLPLVLCLLAACRRGRSVPLGAGYWPYPRQSQASVCVLPRALAPSPPHVTPYPRPAPYSFQPNESRHPCESGILTTLREDSVRSAQPPSLLPPRKPGPSASRIGIMEYRSARLVRSWRILADSEVQQTADGQPFWRRPKSEVGSVGGRRKSSAALVSGPGRWAAIATIGTLLALVVTACSTAGAGGASHSPPGSVATGGGGAAGPSASPVLSSGPAPWPVSDGEGARIAAAGLPALSQEQLAYHIHTHLDIIVDGKSEPVPAEIGIDAQAQLISPVHTHDATGVIHIESSDRRAFTLGQFFTEWGVLLNQSCVGGYCSPQTAIRVYVDGHQFSGDPSTIELTPHEEIALVIGAPPGQVPDHFDFPQGL